MSAVTEIVSSRPSIPPRQRLIVALDVPGADAAVA